MKRRSKRESIIEMIKRGATHGERAAAREALNRYDAAHPDEAEAVQYYNNGFSAKPKPEDYQPGVRMRWEHDRQAESANWQRQRQKYAEEKQAKQREAELQRKRAEHEAEHRRWRRESAAEKYRQQTIDYNLRQEERRGPRKPQPNAPSKPDKYGYYEHIDHDHTGVGDEHISRVHFDGMPLDYVAPHERPSNGYAFLALVVVLAVLFISAVTG